MATLTRRKRPKREDKQINREDPLEEQVFDRETRFALTKLRQAGHFDGLEYPIAKGKEAIVFLATTREGGKVAVKIYRIDTSNFVHMHDYLDGDPRFSGTSRHRFETILAWARKEFSNLSAFYEARVCVPKPLAFLRNIVVMEFFGIENIAYSTLAELGTEHPRKDYEFLLEQMKRIYQAGFVHADFSEYNMLVTDDGLKIIDCAQAVLLAHPRADDFLQRDVQNLVRYFRRQGVREAEFERALEWVKDGKPILKGLEAV
ncbi:MAG: RIO1 family regulatory kinase/ATPase [Candidatus Micrarchaeia archaeon]|jgi:RIO kinase 1